MIVDSFTPIFLICFSQYNRNPIAMNFQKYLERLERLHLLVRRKATGSPCELANKLGLSERQTLEYVRELKDLDIPIAYCKHQKTYYYERDVIFKFEFRTLSKDELRNVEGGGSFQ